MATDAGLRLSAVLLTTANILLPLAIVTFGIGFFPYKPFLPGLAEYEPLEFGEPPSAPFDKLVFMVVDALRSLIRNGVALPFTANARSPTVTMPRLKAITTGSIPSFVDLILNFDEADTSSTLAAQDTWLAQIRAAGKGKLLMFGDDTWLKLFPDTFDHYDGTSSFFVSDFTEVDNNVTRNIARELENTDWGLMVLHYLGLDHIGHKSGPRSSNMLPKQREMDGIVKFIYQALESKDHLKSTLFVLCGDHGMNDAGNHGASSPGETSPALVFMSPKFRDVVPKLSAPMQPKDEFDYYTRVEQSDITPTIAALLGFPISKNNLGAFIPQFLPFWPEPKDQIQILTRNAKQILGVVTAVFGVELFDPHTNTSLCSFEPTAINTLACDWHRLYKEAGFLLGSSELDSVWLSGMAAWLRKAQDLMSSMASNYNIPKLLLGQTLALLAVACNVLAITLLGTTGLGNILPLVVITVSYGGMMFASSYVEEEQHFWYWSSTIWIGLLGLKAIRRTQAASGSLRYLLALSVIRLVRSWNRTGQKFAGEADVVKLFISPNPPLLWTLIIASYLTASLQLMSSIHDLPYVAITSATSVLVSSAFTFKLAFTAEDSPELVTSFAKKMNDAFHEQSLLSRARVVFSILLLLSSFAVYQARKGGSRATSSAKLIHHIYAFLAMTQSRATNIPLLLLSSVLLHLVDISELTVAEITTTSILFQYASFFSFGGSNAISSIDLSSAYNGISGFNIATVGVLTFISNWAGPIFWVVATNLLLLEKHRQGQQYVFRRHLALLTLFSTTSVAFVMAACTVLRTHLFIWTVFSPKYLHCMAWNLAQHLVINVGLGSVLFSLGAS
ncbi:Alkaline-phosphatase-like, core domain protein [Metarhizium album ARSEF 1941]|uniref:GPI ethanolamine phosphate transferase 2 n=1 Tax=Metarhizium album (strain ARSEF 1941) TaxID=1081103 RepID=A0A0B2WNN3_METAS|nr:Alkaline-phosphatase-like, core domain protein [Metarhizium album ARSEF 1941]KHN97666.1 Alkaline-phosphatase-like, core domain protein [Metarhizium album ARSEF 1941]